MPKTIVFWARIAKVVLRHKHSAVESDINRLEHHGQDRCQDKGLHCFKRYCTLGVLAANLHKLGNVQKPVF